VCREQVTIMLQPYDLRCEYAVNPLGIGTSCPRLSWKLKHPERNQRQSAYQIVAAHTLEALEAGDILWNSGKVASSESVAMEWGGKPLKSRDQVYWHVQCWDKNGLPGMTSETAFFEVALLDPNGWMAEWIGYPPAWSGRAIYFRYDFNIDKPVIRARVYAAALGYQELYINGQRVGNDQLDPAFTDISKRVMYRTFDITSQLTQGTNVLGAAVGNGWYGCPRIYTQIELLYDDATSAIYASHESAWMLTCGPVIENTIYTGETYDAREENHCWNLPGETTGKWLGAMNVPAPGGTMTAQMLEPIREMQSLIPKSVTQLAEGTFVVDIGQNIAGWVQIRVKGVSGQRVVMRFAETLYDDGTVNQENLREFPTMDTYILKGDDEEIWEPRFTYHGFRYVQIEGYPGQLTIDDISGKVVRSSVKTAGEFTCSSELLNRIQEMVWWTEQDNYHGIPTDCPQRNERMGWLNDVAARDEEALYNFDLSRFMSKWVMDIQDSQDPKTGGIPMTAPKGWMSTVDPTEPLTVSYLELVWLLYAHYGDKRTLENSYLSMQRWLDRMEAQSEDYIATYCPVADWAPPIDKIYPGMGLSGAPSEIVGTGLYYLGAKLLERVAGLLDKTDDSKKFADISDKVAEAFNKKFWNNELNGYGLSNQSCNCLALRLGLVPDRHRTQVLQSLVHDVVELNQTHLTTGNVCTKYLLEALSENGRSDVALALAEQTTYPSWGYMLEKGATTVWERWELATGNGMNSHNHPMMASVGSWFYKVLAGINVAADAFGFDRVVIQPAFVDGLDYVTASHATVRGVIRSAWHRDGNKIVVNIELPIGCSAELRLPGIVNPTDCEGVTLLNLEKEVVTLVVGSGAYEFVIG